MSFDEILHGVRELVERDGRVAYRVLKRRFELDDEDIEDIKADLIEAKRLARDEDGKVLVWLDGAANRLDADAPASTKRAERENVESASADRRLLTVMFCDIVGSTELATHFDAEDLRELIREYQEICAGVITSFGGYIAQYLGDGLLVYFGYPLALEDEASRSVQSGLGILQALNNAKDLHRRLGEPMRVRIGIHTGPVVIGDMGAGDRQERLALGETPNIAARVQSTARPNEILITGATYRLVEGLFECELHGPHMLKGIATPVDLYTVKSESAAINRFEVALSTGALTKYIGREQELRILEQHWAQACAGRGQAVLLDGEPGIGKSRLVQEFKKHAGEDARHITLRCSPNHQNSAFYSVIHLLRRLFEIKHDDPNDVKVSKIEAGLESCGFKRRAETAPLFAALLSVDHPEAGLLEALAPVARKTMTFEALVEWFLEGHSAESLYLIWDDVHWMDPSTHELLSFYLDRIPASRTLALLVYRSDFTPPWGQHTFFKHLSIGRLPEPDIEAMVADIAGHETVPGPLVQHIKDKTDGIPLFVEELTKTVVEAGLFDASVSDGAHADLDAVAIPATLQDSLEARIDRCPRGKEVARWGAVIGREFGHALLCHLVPDEALLSQGLDELLGAELVYRSGTPAEPTYIFKHALIQDTAYESLLSKKRKACHAEIAEALELHFPDTAAREPELLARHFIEADINERAVEYLYQAGQRAAERSAGAIAQEHLHHALKLIGSLSDFAERSRLELKIQLLLGPLVSTARGNSFPEIEAIYNRALDLCEKAGDETSRFPAYFGLRAYYLARSDLASAHGIGLDLYAAAKAGGGPEYLLEANVALISSYFFRGELEPVDRHTAEGLTLYDRAVHGKHAALYGLEPGSVCLIRRAQNVWFQGFPDQARTLMREALELVDEVGHAVSQAFIHGNASTLDYWLARYEDVEAHAGAAIDIAEVCGITFVHGWSLVQRGHARIHLERHDAGLKDIEDGMAVLEQSMSPEAVRSQLMFSWLMTLIADAYGQMGDPEKGLAVLPEAIALIEKTGARYSEPALFRVRGELLHRMNLNFEAEKSLLKSLELARARGARSFELQSAISLARLWGELGRGPEAHETLSDAITPFTEGFDTHDLSAARGLLERFPK